MSVLEWLGLKKPSVIGVDISSTTVKLIQLSNEGSYWLVEGYAIEPLGDAAMQDEEGFSSKLVTKAIQAALEKYPFTAKHAAIAIPGASAISKIIQMPAFIKSEDFAAQIYLEASKHIPYSIEEVHIDWQILGPNENVEEEVDVLLVAAKADIVDPRVKAVEDAGLTVEYVDVETFVIERALAGLPSVSKSPGCQAIVDVGATSTNLCILHEGKSIYAREQEFGGRQLTEAIMQHYGMTYGEAGKAKREKSLPDDYKEAVFEPFQQALIQEIKRGLEFFYSSTEHSTIENVLIGGATIQEEQVISNLSEIFNVPVKLVNPLENMRIEDKALQKPLANDCAALIICCGLGMRGQVE